MSIPTEPYNILMYSHDTYGLGHIRRTLAIARALAGEGINILILTGSPLVGRFDFPHGTDFVRIPGMIKQGNNSYVPHAIRVTPEYAMNIRQEIITATAKSFNPSLFIVDKAPLGLNREILPTLHWFKQCRPTTRVVLGLRDIMDDAQSTRSDWDRKDIYRVLEELYTEIWVYGDRKIYDPVVEYKIPDQTTRKIFFTGYIHRNVPAPAHRASVRKEQKITPRDKLILVTTGGGGDGYQILDTYLSMLESQPAVPFRTIMISGPFLPANRQEELARRASACNVHFYTFLRKIEKIMAAADLIISMGGYNTICEILSLHKPSLIIPRETPRLEQYIRAELMAQRGLLDHLAWKNLQPDHLYEKILQGLEHGPEIREKIASFPMSGLEFMRTRLREFRNEEKNTSADAPPPTEHRGCTPDKKSPVRKHASSPSPLILPPVTL